MIKNQPIRVNLKLYTVIGLFGSLGAVLRYCISEWTVDHYVGSFPWSTVVCNLLGCLFLGWFSSYIAARGINRTIQIGISVGLIGSFTTFSTFSIEMINMIQGNQWLYAFAYLGLSLIGGWLLAWMGYRTGVLMTTYRSRVEERDGT